MKFMHLSDLHIGKRVNDYSMLEDQKHIFKEILQIATAKNIDSVLIAGDVYDKAVPSAEAVDLFDDFLTGLSEKDIPIFVISGNHDSPERLAFGSRIMGKHKVHIAGEYNGSLPQIKLEDEFGSINLFLMPYLKPAIVNKRLSMETTSFDACVRAAIGTVEVNSEERNILLAHQFVTAGGNEPETSDSEVKSLGGMDNVDVSAFDAFDYVALGHIHGPQPMGSKTVRYGGSPIKYSFSECKQHKGVTIIELKEKGNIQIEIIPLNPLRDMKEIRCTLADLLSGQTFEEAPKDSYVHITLIDEDEIVDAIGKVREVYQNVMVLDFDNQRTKENLNKNRITGEDIRQKSTEALFADFYFNQNNIQMTDRQVEIFAEITSRLEGRA